MRKFIPFIIIVLIYATSCKTTYLKVQVFDPPEVNIPVGITGMVVVNNTGAEFEDPENDPDSSMIAKALNTKEASTQFVKAFVNGLNGTPRFRKVVLDSLKQKRFSNSATDWINIEDVCLRNRSSGLFSLRSLNSSVSVITSKLKSSPDNDESNQDLYKARLSSKIFARFRLYDPVNRGYFEELPYYDSLVWENTAVSLEEAISGLPDKITAIRETGIYCGEKYSKKIVPDYINVKRMIYTSGHEKLKKAAVYVKENKWLQAAQTWIKLERETNNEKIAGYAAYNLAVAEEIRGGINAALSWANRSNNHLRKNSTLKYINVINKRIMELDN